METGEAPAGSQARLPVNRPTFLQLWVSNHWDLEGFPNPREASPHPPPRSLADCTTPEPTGKRGGGSGEGRGREWEENLSQAPAVIAFLYLLSSCFSKAKNQMLISLQIPTYPFHVGSFKVGGGISQKGKGGSEENNSVSHLERSSCGPCNPIPPPHPPPFFCEIWAKTVKVFSISSKNIYYFGDSVKCWFYAHPLSICPCLRCSGKTHNREQLTTLSEQ